jgi:membrane-bound metal-dependent hydrolase YbcI (DUF457 family)
VTKISHIFITGSVAILAGSGPIGLAGAIVGAKVPDLDIPLGISHRTLTHWWAVYASGLFYLTFFTPSLNSSILIFLHWLLIGALLHILEDSLTTGGVPLLTPFPIGSKSFERVGTMRFSKTKRFSFGLTKTGGKLEYIILAIMIAIVVYTSVLHSGAIFSKTDMAQITQLFHKAGE